MTRPTGRGRATPPYRADVEGLRAVAVVLVVLYHSGVPHLAGGYVGVDVFFVISGYLITSLLVAELHGSNTLSFAGFYARRARRILPMATIVLAATAIAFSFVVLPLDRGTLRGDEVAAGLYFANWHFAQQSLLYGTTASLNPVIHYWSLCVEEQFYLVWPAVLFLLTWHSRRRPDSKQSSVVVIGLLAIIAVSLGASIGLTAHDPTYSYYGLHTRAWELAAGGMLAVAAARIETLPGRWRRPVGWIGLGLIVFAGLHFGQGTIFPGIAAVVPVGGALLIIAAGTGQGTGRFRVGRLLELAPVTYTGRISYSLYLWHWPCLIFVGTAVAPRGSGFRVAAGWWAVLAIAAAIGLSAVSYHLVENPVRAAPWLRPPRQALAAGAVASALAVVAAFAILPTSDGAIRQPVLADTTSLTSPAGAGNSPVYVTLRMTPGQARADAPEGTRSCFSAYRSSSVSANCLFGDPDGGRTIALVGDSHALALFPAVEQLAQAEHWRLWFWAKAACPMIDLKVQLPQLDNSYPWCTQWQHGVIARLAAIPDLDTVFVTHYGGVARIPDRFAVGNRTLRLADLPAAWHDAWARTDGQLSAVSRRVVVIRDTPDPDTDTPNCLDAHAPDVVPCSIPRDVAFAAADTLYDAERPASGPTTYFIDLADVLCPGTGPCPVITAAGDIIYRDDEHLTATVSRQLMPALRAKVLALDRTSPSP